MRKRAGALSSWACTALLDVVRTLSLLVCHSSFPLVEHCARHFYSHFFHVSIVLTAQCDVDNADDERIRGIRRRSHSVDSQLIPRIYLFIILFTEHYILHAHLALMLSIIFVKLRKEERIRRNGINVLAMEFVER